VSLLHRDPPYTAKSFFYHRRLVFAMTTTLVVGLAALAAYDGGRLLLPIDEPITRWFVDIRTPMLTDLFNIASRVGDNVVVFTAAAVLAAFTWKHCRYLAIALVLAALMRPAVEFVLKAAVDRPRPLIDPLGEFAGPSHPSGHPMAAASLLGLVPAWVALHVRSRRLWWTSVFVCFGLVTLVAVARVYKGAHYFTDVVAAWAWAGLYLAAVQGFFDRFHAESQCLHPQHEVQVERHAGPDDGADIICDHGARAESKPER
jgi:undecaprenyl-diphosphatase